MSEMPEHINESIEEGWFNLVTSLNDLQVAYSQNLMVQSNVISAALYQIQWDHRTERWILLKQIS